MDRVASKEVEFVISTALILEYEDAALRQRAEIQLSDDELEALFDSIAALGHPHFPFILWRPFLPDPKDDHVLERAVVSQVKEIVTFNHRDFRGIEKFGIRAISPNDFLIEKGVIQ